MKFALVNGVRKTAEPNEFGRCICCNNEVRAYCGLERVNHWKHKRAIECDTWSEGETEWHRKWKNCFDIDQQEIVKYDSKSGEKHIADIYIESIDLVIEFQHSPIHINEIKAREFFYKKMIWVVDIKPFKKNISFHRDIGNAFNKYFQTSFWNDDYQIIQKLETHGNIKGDNSLMDEKEGADYFRHLEKQYFPDYFERSRKAGSAIRTLKALEELKKTNPDIEGYLFSEEYMNKLNEWAQEHLQQKYILMLWKRKHKRWDNAQLPLFFDIGDGFVYFSMENIKHGSGYIVKKIRRQEFVNYYKNPRK